MGQKVHPHGFRVGVIKDWDSRWYARPDKVGDLVVEDYRLREYLHGKLGAAGIPKIEIERDNARVRVIIHCSKPGVVIGRNGQEIEKLKAELQKRTGKNVAISIVEVKSPDANAQLVAEGIAQKLERRIGFRKAMKNSMQRAMKLGVRGIKVMVSGRLGGAEIARSETYHEGTIPLQTLRADIDYGFAEAKTTYGRIGVKVWVYNGEILSQTLRSAPRVIEAGGKNRDRKPRGDRRPARTGGYQGGQPRTGGYQGGQRTGYQGGQSSGGYQGGQRTSGYQGSAPRTGAAPAPTDGGNS
jgi:small subunit ribosomal protein S3